MRSLSIALSVLAVAACDAPRPAPPDPLEKARSAIGAEEALHDAHDDVLLFVRALPTRPDGDGVRKLVVRRVKGGQVTAIAGEDRPASDAKLVDGGVVVLFADGVLARVGDDGGTRTLDRDAFGPLSVRAGRVAYVRGQEPDLEVALADVDRGAPVALTTGWAPTWCPALADDGSVVFVSGRTGGLELARVKPGEAPRTLAKGDGLELPEGPLAPLSIGSSLVFESAGALRVVGLDGRLRRATPGLLAPIAIRANGVESIVVHGNDPRSLHALPASEVVAP